AVSTFMAKHPSAEMALVSAWIPAPPLPSNPAMLSTVGTCMGAVVFIITRFLFVIACRFPASLQLFSSLPGVEAAANGRHHGNTMGTGLKNRFRVLFIDTADCYQGVAGHVPDFPEALQSPFRDGIGLGGRTVNGTNSQVMNVLHFRILELGNHFQRPADLQAVPELGIDCTWRDIGPAHVHSPGFDFRGNLRKIIYNERDPEIIRKFL